MYTYAELQAKGLAAALSEQCCTYLAVMPAAKLYIHVCSAATIHGFSDAGQVALVAGSVYTCVEILAGCLFLATRDKQGNGYYPCNAMVRHLCLQRLQCVCLSSLYRLCANPAKIKTTFNILQYERC